MIQVCVWIALLGLLLEHSHWHSVFPFGFYRSLSDFNQKRFQILLFYEI